MKKNRTTKQKLKRWIKIIGITLTTTFAAVVSCQTIGDLVNNRYFTTERKRRELYLGAEHGSNAREEVRRRIVSHLNEIGISRNHVRGLDILLSSQNKIAELYDPTENEKIEGIYRKTFRQIRTMRNPKSNIPHEIGHNVWENILSEDGRKEFERKLPKYLELCAILKKEMTEKLNKKEKDGLQNTLKSISFDVAPTQEDMDYITENYKNKAVGEFYARIYERLASRMSPVRGVSRPKVYLAGLDELERYFEGLFPYSQRDTYPQDKIKESDINVVVPELTLQDIPRLLWWHIKRDVAAPIDLIRD